jgi:predicted acetyltransferase
MLAQGRDIARELGFGRVLCVCDEDNLASERVIIKNGGIFENRLYDDEEKVFVKRYWIDL